MDASRLMLGTNGQGAMMRSNLNWGELGSRYPQAGGEYIYLKETFGKWMGFLSGWISLVVGFSAPIAAAAIAFAIYAFQMLSITAGPPLIIPVIVEL